MKAKDADAEITALKELLENQRQQYADKCLHLIASENARVQAESLLDAIDYMIEGEQGKNEPSDFMMSFGIVRDVWDHFQNYECEIATLKDRVKALEAAFDLIHAADQRAIKLWQEAHPGKGNMWPDQAKMVCWLMEQLNEKQKILDLFEQEFDKDLVDCQFLHDRIDNLEVENKRLKEALENVLLAVNHEDYYNDAVLDVAREAIKED